MLYSLRNSDGVGEISVLELCLELRKVLGATCVSGILTIVAIVAVVHAL